MREYKQKQVHISLCLCSEEQRALWVWTSSLKIICRNFALCRMGREKGEGRV